MDISLGFPIGLILLTLQALGPLDGIHLVTKRVQYLTRVTNVCPDDTTGTSTVTVLTDIIETIPYAVCRGKQLFEFFRINKATWNLIAHFQGDPSANCVLYQKDDSFIYVIDVYVPLTGGLVLGKEMPTVVTCTYEAHLETESVESLFADSLRPLRGRIDNAGSRGQSTIDLYLADVRNRRLTGRISLRRTVKLRADLQGDVPGEVGFQVLECYAIGRVSDYHILIGGCGDGMVLGKGAGFTATGRSSVSPLFKTFKMVGSPKLSFKCIFILCSSNCDGNSCDYIQDSTNNTVAGTTP